MDATTPDFEVTRNDAAGRYELRIDDDLVSYADFRKRDDAIVVSHVETNRAERGRGYSTLLMEAVVDDVRERSLKIVPYCSFARAHVSALPDAADLIAR